MLPLFELLLGKNQSSADPNLNPVHINQEMYKKSVELSERNKTLLLLRKIDEIILSSITEPSLISENVTSILVAEAGFQIATVFAYDRENGYLKRLSISRGRKVSEYNDDNLDYFYLNNIPLSNISNMIVQSIVGRRQTSSNSLQNSILSENAEKDFVKIKDVYGIKSVFNLPLIVRDQLIGVLVMCLSEEEQDVSEYTHDMLTRLVQIIGIAIDNGTLYNDLQNANVKLKSLDKLKDEFVSLAAHELRTPMTAIKSYLWMTLDGRAGSLNTDQKLYLERAYSSVNRLIELVNDMLNISRIESGRLSIAVKEVDLYKLTQDVIAEVLPRAQELGINIFVANPTPAMPHVIADTDKIKEVLINLIGNSLKFTPKGGNITISFYQNGDYLETLVKDTGSGISEDNITKLFQKFSMLSDSYKVNNKASGTGLGLYISRSIIELHKGKMWAYSEGLGKGSEFRFSLRVYDEKTMKGFVPEPKIVIDARPEIIQK